MFVYGKGCGHSRGIFGVIWAPEYQACRCLGSVTGAIALVRRGVVGSGDLVQVTADVPMSSFELGDCGDCLEDFVGFRWKGPKYSVPFCGPTIPSIRSPFQTCFLAARLR